MTSMRSMRCRARRQEPLLGAVRVGCLAALLGGLVAGAASAAPPERLYSIPLVSDGDPAPTAGEGVTFATFGAPQINDAGDIAFEAILAGTGVTTANDESLWILRDGALSMVAREGDPALGTSAGESYGPIGSFGFSNAGQVVFFNVLGNAGPCTHALYGPILGGALGLLARLGDPAPGGGFFGSVDCDVGFLESYHLGDGGHVVFSGVASGSRGLWRVGPEGIERLFAEGDPAPGLPAGVTLDDFEDVVSNGQGHAGFVATVHRPATGDSVQAYFAPGADGEPTVAAQEGEGVAGLGPGTWIAAFVGRSHVSDLGQTLISVRLGGSEVTTANDSAVLRFDPFAGAILEAREGEPAPGSGLALGALTFGVPAATRLGDAFLFSGHPSPFRVFGPDGAGTYRVAAESGAPVPDRHEEQFATLSFSSYPAVNDAGAVAFGGAIDDSWAFFVGTPDGRFRTVVVDRERLRLPNGTNSLPVRLIAALASSVPTGAADALHEDLRLTFMARTAGFARESHAIYVAQLRLCADGRDNDGDGLIDLDDPGCEDEDDFTERGAATACDNGIDDDGDGWTDYSVYNDALPDPACANGFTNTEVSQCQNGLDDDGDGRIDFDGGASLNGGVPLAEPDGQCQGRGWWNRERPSGCGLGFEAALALAALLAARGHRERRR